MKYAYEKRIGTRRILGADHPVMAVVYKAAGRKWVSATLCNGLAQNASEYRTLREALEAAGGRKPAQAGFQGADSGRPYERGAR